jgi:uracil-DNA glycosylase family 4
MATAALEQLLTDIGACQICANALPHAPRPVLRASADSRILVVGQAPGTRVHATGIPWNDPSGRLLREWLAINDDTFYNTSIYAIVPMGFCYPGKGKSGDLPPRLECAPAWHHKLLALMPDLQLVLLIGQYAQRYYLPSTKKMTLTERVKRYADFLPRFFPLPHPSPRNKLWLRRNPWFEEDVIPELRRRVQKIIA